MKWHATARPESRCFLRRLGVTVARRLLVARIMRSRRPGLRAFGGQRAWRSFRVLVTLGGSLGPFGSAACSPNDGTSCTAAGGTCVLGSVACAKQAAASAQDCNTNPPNPGGAFCCLERPDSGSFSDDVGPTPAPDGSSSDAAVDTDACSPVLASNYDQSCDADTQCVGVGEVPQCPAGACNGCLTQAVNQGAVAEYMAALSRALASVGTGEACNCPCEALAICRSGKCEYGFCGPPSTDTLPACADAGGQCSYSANSTCNAMGPPDSCAYSDEVCCTR